VPDAVHLANEVVDWMWLDMTDPDLFVPGSAHGGRAVVLPDWPLLSVWVYISEANPPLRPLPQGRVRSVTEQIVASIAAGCRNPDGQPST